MFFPSQSMSFLAAFAIGIDISPTACRVKAKRLTVKEILDEKVAMKLV